MKIQYMLSRLFIQYLKDETFIHKNIDVKFET